MGCEELQEVLIEFKGRWELDQKLIDTVQELNKDRASLVIRVLFIEVT